MTCSASNVEMGMEDNSLLAALGRFLGIEVDCDVADGRLEYDAHDGALLWHSPRAQRRLRVKCVGRG